MRNVTAPDMWAAKCDVADAFFINSLHVSERAHHVIWDPTPAGWTPPPGSEEAEFEGAGVHQYAAEGPESLRRYWRYTVTPFGSKLSPFYLSTLVDDLVSHLQETWSSCSTNPFFYLTLQRLYDRTGAARTVSHAAEVSMRSPS